MKDNLIVTKTYDFAIIIVNLHKRLTLDKEYVLSKQILRSGTSIGANVEEAVGGISRKDFRAKSQLLIKKQEKHIIGQDF